MKRYKPQTHHIDKTADRLLSRDGGADDLLTTDEVAEWLGCSHQWLEIGRINGYGPNYTKISTRMVRYRRSDVNTWLKERVHSSTAEYSRRSEKR